MRTRVYVDGFNLYYGALKGTRCKWLDLVKLVDLLFPDGHTVDLLRYFTARVSGIANSRATARQHASLQVLDTITPPHPEELHFAVVLAYCWDVVRPCVGC